MTTGREFITALNRNLTDAEALAGQMPGNLRDAVGFNTLIGTATQAELDVRSFQVADIATGEDATIPAYAKVCHTQSYSAEAAYGVGGARYKRVTAEPSHDLKFRSTDRYMPNGTTDSTTGGWWEIAEPFVDIEMAGARAVNGFDNGPPIQRVADYIMTKTYGGLVLVPEGKYDVLTQVVIPKSYRTVRLQGVSHGSVIVCHKVTTTDYEGAAFYLGDDGDPATDGTLTVSNIQFTGSTGAGVALYLDHANGAVVERCQFHTLKKGIVGNESYAVRLLNNKARYLSDNFFHSETACFNLVANCNQITNTATSGETGCGVFRIEAQSLNCVFRDNDIEVCGSVWNVVAGTWKTWIIEGNYLEYISEYIIVTSGSCTFRGLMFNYNQLNDCLDWAFPKTIGGEFIGNVVNEMAVNFVTNGCEDIDIGHTVYGTNVSVSAPPFKTPTLSNGYTAVGTRTLGYRKAADGLVTLRGYANSGTANQIIFTLPTTHRPERLMTYLTPKSDGTAIMVTVNNNNGNVTCNSTDVCLDGIHFIAQVSNINL